MRGGREREGNKGMKPETRKKMREPGSSREGDDREEDLETRKWDKAQCLSDRKKHT